MPSNWQTIDTNFPTFTGKESPQQQIQALHNYLFQLREGLQYSLQNLTVENFSAATLQNLSEAQKNEITRQLHDVNEQIEKLEESIKNIENRKELELVDTVTGKTYRLYMESGRLKAEMKESP